MNKSISPDQLCYLREDRMHMFLPVRRWPFRLRWVCSTCDLTVVVTRRPSFQTKDGFVQFWVGKPPPPSVRKPR